MAGDGHSNPTSLPPAPEGWRVNAIEDLCEKVTSGGTPLRSNASFYQGGTHSWFKTQELKDCILMDAGERITDKALAQTSAKLFPKDTVLMAMYGDGKTITSLGILSKEAATNQACCAMIPNRSRCEPRFLFYALKHHRSDFLRIASGGAQRNLSGKLIRRFAINTPLLDEQRAIAHILGTLDDKIELNWRMNETLEAMARTLFRSWFVDFDPVRAKAERRDPGLPKPLADLFPDSFEGSKLGEIPKGWGVGPLDSVLVLQRGFDLPATQRTSGAYPVLAASGPSGTHNEFMVRGPGVTTGRSGVLGKVFYVHEDFWPLNTSLWVKEFRHSTPAYAFHLLRGLDFALFNAGSAVPTLNRNHVHNLPTLLPPMKVVAAFERVATSSLNRQKQNDDQSRTIATLRDTLLPKLLSGEIRMGDTAKIGLQRVKLY